MKNDCSLFSRLFIACQTRNGDMDEFFQHENQVCTPSICDDGNLPLPQKSGLATCLQAVTTPQRLMDGVAIVNMVKPSTGDKTFEDYAMNRFNPYIPLQLQTTRRIDIVWDEYIESSLKLTTRDKRGRGVRQHVALQNKLPKNWRCFLQNCHNKQELFRLLAECATSINYRENRVVSSCAEDMLSRIPLEDASILAPCSH